MPSAFASSISRSVASRTWPTLPGGPSSSSDVTVWTESTTSSPGSRRARELDDPADAGLGDDADRVADRPAGQPEPPRAQPDLRRPTPRPSRRARVGAGRGDAGRGLEQERGLADARLAAQQDDRPGDEAAAQDAVELADADRAPQLVVVDGARGGSGTGVAAPRRCRSSRFSARGRGDSRTTVSTSVFQSPQVRHWPSQRSTAAPHDWQT